MKKASAKLRRKIKVKFCREISKMEARFSSSNRRSQSRK